MTTVRISIDSNIGSHSFDIGDDLVAADPNTERRRIADRLSKAIAVAKRAYEID